MGYCRRNLAASPLLSIESTPMKATRLPSDVDSFWKCGNSARHGPHQEAHWFTTTGWPFSEASRCLNAGAPPPSSSQPCSWSDASGGGAPFREAGTVPHTPPALLPSPPPPPPACVNPITSTATSATAPRAIAIRFIAVQHDKGAGAARSSHLAPSVGRSILLGVVRCCSSPVWPVRHSGLRLPGT